MITFLKSQNYEKVTLSNRIDAVHLHVCTGVNVPVVLAQTGQDDTGVGGASRGWVGMFELVDDSVRIIHVSLQTLCEYTYKDNISNDYSRVSVAGQTYTIRFMVVTASK